MSSVGEIGVTIKAVNEATPEFEAVASDAARMASDVEAQAVTIRTENLARAHVPEVTSRHSSVL